MKTIMISGIAASAFLLATPSAFAALVLQINPTNQTMALTGSLKITPVNDGFGFNPVGFTTAEGTGGGGFGSATIPPPLIFYSLDRADANNSLSLASLPGQVSLNFLFDSPAELTITGEGNFFDYGAAFANSAPPGDPNPAERIDSIPNGTVFVVNQGTGNVGSITVQIVPEPSSALLALAGILPLTLRRKRR